MRRLLARLVRIGVGILVCLSFLAGLIGVDLRRAHDAATMVLAAVDTSDIARHQPNEWSNLVFVLLVGSDERPGLEGARGDALHVVGLNPGAGKATIIDIPRDTWVEIPGHGQGRVNEAYRYGGAQLQAQTVSRLTGAPISYVLTTTFAGLVAGVDKLGGLDVDVPFPMDDKNSGAAFLPGRQRLSGAQVLAFSRNRHIPTGDLLRSANQGQVIIHMLESLRAKGSSATDVINYLDVLYRNVRTVGIGPTDLFRLGRAALAVQPANVRNYPMPATTGQRGALSVVFVKQPQAGRVFQDFVDDGILQAH